MATKVYVSGMPIYLRMYNGEYYQASEDAYALTAETYFGCLIGPTYIIRGKSFWSLETRPPKLWLHTVAIGDDLIGDWDIMTVTEKPTWRTWWQSNWGIILFSTTVIGAFVISR